MSKIIDRAGSGIPITPVENDSNLDSLHGINQVIAGATHTVDITDQGDTLEFTNAGAVAVTLDDIATIQGAAHTSDFKVTLLATNAATVATITPDATDSINTGVATIVLTVDEYVTLQTDSTGAVWNIIGSSDASQVGGLSASQFLRSDASDITTGDLTIQKATPALSLKCAAIATEDIFIFFRDESNVVRNGLYRSAASSLLYLDARNAAGAIQARLSITEAGKVNIVTGTFQLAGVDVTSTAAELNILDGVTSTTAELNITDGDTADSSVTIVDADQLIINDGGTMKQTAVTDLDTYYSQTTKTLTNKTLSGGAITSDTVQATTSGAAVDFTGIPSWVKRIDIDLNGVSTAAASILAVQIGDSGGFETSGYAFTQGEMTNGANPLVSGNNSFSECRVAIVTDANALMSGTITLKNITGNDWVLSSTIVNTYSARVNSAAGNKTLTGTLTQVRLKTGSTTFDAGSANITYEG